MQATGWLRDYPCLKDYSLEEDSIQEGVKKTDVLKIATLAPRIDLRQFCSPMENQGSIGSCTANAAAGLVEFMEKQAYGKYTDGSRRFLYKVTRNLLKWKGDTGAYLRSTLGALVQLGIPPEEYFPYNEAQFDEEPSSFVYSLARNYQALKYYRLDTPNMNTGDLLTQIKSHLQSKIPSIFGFTCYSSLDSDFTTKTGYIQFPERNERVTGGHAVMCVGYDNSISLKGLTKGAFIIRNSWGQSWGEKGFGYLPFDYVLQGLAVDWWVLIQQEWMDTDKFKE